MRRFSAKEARWEWREDLWRDEPEGDRWGRPECCEGEVEVAVEVEVEVEKEAMAG